MTQLAELVSGGQIDMRWSDAVMEASICADGISEDRVRGMLLGLAIGDSLGNTTEGWLPAHRRLRFGEIRNYLPNPHAGMQSAGVPSDDTQLAFWTLEHILDRKHVQPEELARLFASRQIYGIGKSTAVFVRDIQAGKSWLRASQRTAGNGALTRAATVVAAHLWRRPQTIWSEVALSTAITHNDPTAIGANIALASMLIQLLQLDRAPDKNWWVGEFVRIASAIEGETRLRPRAGPLEGAYEGPVRRQTI